jgi:hypothetical protein
MIDLAEMADSDKHASLLQHDINYRGKSFIFQAPEDIKLAQ